MQNKIISKEEFLSISETAEVIGVSVITLRRWDNAGRLKAVRYTSRSHRRYKLNDIIHFMETHLMIKSDVGQRSKKLQKQVSLRSKLIVKENL